MSIQERIDRRHERVAPIVIAQGAKCAVAEVKHLKPRGFPTVSGIAPTCAYFGFSPRRARYEEYFRCTATCEFRA